MQTEKINEIISQIKNKLDINSFHDRKKILYAIAKHLFLGESFDEMVDEVDNFICNDNGIDFILNNEEDDEWTFFIFMVEDTLNEYLISDKMKGMYERFLKLKNMPIGQLLKLENISDYNKKCFEEFNENKNHEDVKFILLSLCPLKDDVIKEVKNNVVGFITADEYFFDIFDAKAISVKYDIINQDNSISNSLTFEFDYYNKDNYDENNNMKNIISYDSGGQKGIILSLSAKTLSEAFIKYKSEIFEHNIRYGISSGRDVDDGIKNTVNEEPGNFWFYNNGVTITCEKWDINSFKNKINIKNFSIVNGAQTITNLSKLSLKGNDINSIYIPAKIIKPNNDNDVSKKELLELTDTITKTANSQKPVKPRDFKSNTPEMKELKDNFKNKGIILNIKRGDVFYKDKIDKEWIIKNLNISKPNSIDNDALAQIVLSLMLLDPCKGLQNKNKIFSDEKLYDEIFRNDKIDSDDIYNAYKFYKFIVNKIASADSEIVFKSPVGTENFKADMVTLKEHIKKWLVTLFWIINYKINDIETIVKYPILDNILPNKPAKNDLVILLKNIQDESNAFVELVYRAYRIIDDIYADELKNIQNNGSTKSNSLSFSAFSFRKKAFEKFILNFFVEMTKNRKENLIEWIKKIG